MAELFTKLSYSVTSIMKNTGKWLLCSIYIIVVGVFFIYYLFPSDAVKKYIAFNLNRANPELNITIDNIKPVFPPGLRLYNVSLYRLSNLLLEAKQIKITPGLLSLFRPKTTFFFKAEAYEGLLESFSFESIAADIAMNNQKIQINECIIKGNQADGRISGSVNLKNPLGKSVLDLTGTIKPHQLLIENLQKSFPVKSLLKTGKGGLPIRLYGTIDQPGFSLK